jgi:outer membrane receptor protein involved in Fe transport
MSIKHISFILALSLLGVAPIRAQQGDGLPKLDVETITVVGKRVLTLPKARKGEVLDTSIYRLPATDTLLFGERVSNLSGTAGPLPGYRELASPLRLNYEASLGSYLSPRALVRGEYLQKSYDFAGVIDYMGTQGHIDSAKASSFLLGAHGSVAVGGDDPAIPKSRVSGDLEYLGDSYFLYGNRATPFDRSRTGTRLVAGFRSQQDGPVDYTFNVDLGNTSIDDRLRDSTRNASALAAGVNFELGAGGDSLRGRFGLDYSTTSLRYDSSTFTPAYIALRLGGDWVPAPGLFVTAGIFYANGQHSDSGSTMLLLPRASIRYQLDPQISLFAWYAPELRPPSYRSFIMRAPYVDRQITLRPEKVPVNLSAGMRLATEPMTIEARALFRSADNTPVVAASATPGSLRYAYVNSRTVGAEGTIELTVVPDITVQGDALFESAIIRESSEQLPMTPQIDLRGRIDYRLNQKLGLFATLGFQSAQRTVLADSALPEKLREIGSRALIGGGASYGITDNLGIFAEFSNLLNYNYEVWQNYLAPGFEIRAGVRGKF